MKLSIRLALMLLVTFSLLSSLLLLVTATAFANDPTFASSSPSPTATGSIKVTATAFANNPTFLDPRNFGTEQDSTKAVVVGDMDGDGDLDIVAGNDGGQNLVYLNNPAGTFTPVPFGPITNTRSIAIGDMNGDGNLDIVAGNDGQQNMVYLNNLAGTFKPVPFGPITDTTHSIAVGDMDADGDLDIVAGNGGQPNVVYLNDGATYAPSKCESGIGSDARSLAIAHLNKDDKLDIVAANGGQVVVYLNDGAGCFPSGRSFGEASDDTWSVAVGNVDGDGDLDIVAGNYPGKNAVYLNNGAGTFTPVPFGEASIDTPSVAMGDMDGDGDLDIVIGNYVKPDPNNPRDQPNAVYLNDGAGKFPTKRDFGTGSDKTESVAVGDMDGDGHLDILVGNDRQQSVVYLNDGAGSSLTGRYVDTGSYQIESVAVGDMDGDGHLDIVAGTDRQGNTPTSNRVYLNDGAGIFATNLRFGTREDPNTTDSVAVGDMDGDGDLDIVAGNSGKNAYLNVYLNKGADGFPAGPSLDSGPGRAYSVAVGDMDGDGDLDIVAGNSGYQNVVYLNDGTGTFTTSIPIPFGPITGTTHSVAVGDMDRDGDLDIIAGNYGQQQDAVYLNSGAGNFPTSGRNFGKEWDQTDSVAVGDMDGDGDLDIVVGNNGRRNVVYLNDGAGNFPTGRDFGTGSDKTESVAVGDMDGDGDLDIVAGNMNQESVVYLNDGAGNFPRSGHNFGKEWGLIRITSVAMGDMDGDGDLDIVSGHDRQPSVVYLNGRADSVRRLPNNPPRIAVARPDSPDANFQSTRLILDAPVITITYTLSDTERNPVRFVRAWYSLDGGDNWQPAVAATRTKTANLPTGKHTFQWDTSGFFGQSDNVVFRLEAYTDLKPYTYTVPGPYQHPYASATTFPFRVRGTQVQAYSNTMTISNTLSEAMVYHLPAGKERGAKPFGGVEKPFRTSANGFLQGRAEIKAGKTVTESDRLVAVWPTAEVTATTPTRLYASRDTFPMTTTIGSVIQSRLVISDARRIAAINVWADISATVPISLNLETPRGNRIPLQSGPLPPGEPLCDAEAAGRACGAAARRIFTPTLPAPSQPLAEGTWTLVASTAVTEPAQLRGWGLALKLSPLYLTSAAPITNGLDSYPVKAGGVQTLTVSTRNPLLLFDLDVALEWNASQDERYQAQLSADLRRASEFLYDWTNGQAALGNVRVYHDARRNVLPDGTNAWNNAHVRIYASNRLRPNADQGGVISKVFTETVQIGNEARPISYLPGQVRMGATWNRYSDAMAGDLGDDWPAAFAHELGHYLLFLDDNYLTLWDNLIVPLSDDGCPGAMNNPYSKVYSEFHPELDWKTTDCKKTLSELNTGRSDWETITHFYPGLNAPTGAFTRKENGPSLLPLAVTQVAWQAPDPNADTLTWLAQALGKANADPKTLLSQVCTPGAAAFASRVNPGLRGGPGRLVSPGSSQTAPIGCPTEAVTSTMPLEVPIFYLKAANAGETYRASSQARGFLFQGSPYPMVVDLGQPNSDQVVARGARPLDRLCVYDQPQGLVGCNDVEAGDDQVTMRPAPGWEPQLIIAPVTTRTLQISLTLPLTDVNKGLPLLARLYPMDAPSPQAISMTAVITTGTQIVYSVPITTEDQVLEGYVWVGSPNDNARDPHQTVTEFAIGGNPVRIRAMHSPTDPRNVRIHAMHVRIHAMHAPATSADGQVMVYPDEEQKALSLDREWSFTLQPATRLPAEIPWATPVGRAYWLTASDNIRNQDLGQSSITFEYLRSDVPAGEEAFIRMYFWEEKPEKCPEQRAPCWRMLDKQERHPEDNLISARLAGPGLYALFSHYEIPLQPGWNLIGYPVQGTRPITEALASIAGEYSMVFGFDDATPAGPWSVYIPDEDGGGKVDWVNDLREFRFGHGYWIYVDKKVGDKAGTTLRLKGNPETSEPLTTTLAADTLRNPPAIYFGKVQSERANFVPAAGMAVKAYVGEALCGEGKLGKLDSELRYVVKVRAASVSEMGCGTPGAPVSFRVAELPAVILPSPGWDNSVPHPQDLRIPAGPGSVAPPPPAACRELVRNGAFETDSAWKRPVTDSRGRLVQRNAQHGRSLLLGVLPGEATPRGPTYSTAFQNDILLPSAASAITLSFAVQTDAREGSNGRVMQLYRRDWAFPPLTTVPIPRSDGWQTMTVDLTPLKGQYVNLYFEIANAGFKPTRWMAIDDVSIKACQ